MGIIQAEKWLAPSLNALLNDNGVIKETYIKEGQREATLERR